MTQDEIFQSYNENILTIASLMKKPSIDPHKAIVKGKYFDYIPNNVFAYARTNGIEDSGLLAKILEPIKGEYDHIIIDTPPYLGIDTTNAIFASDIVMIVTDFSKGSITGIRVLMSVLDKWHDKSVAKSFKNKGI